MYGLAKRWFISMPWKMAHPLFKNKKKQIILNLQIVVYIHVCICISLEFIFIYLINHCIVWRSKNSTYIKSHFKYSIENCNPDFYCDTKEKINKSKQNKTMKGKLVFSMELLIKY